MVALVSSDDCEDTLSGVPLRIFLNNWCLYGGLAYYFVTHEAYGELTRLDRFMDVPHCDFEECCHKMDELLRLVSAVNVDDEDINKIKYEEVSGEYYVS